MNKNRKNRAIKSLILQCADGVQTSFTKSIRFLCVNPENVHFIHYWSSILKGHLWHFNKRKNLVLDIINGLARQGSESVSHYMEVYRKESVRKLHYRSGQQAQAARKKKSGALGAYFCSEERRFRGTRVALDAKRFGRFWTLRLIFVIRVYSCV